MLGEIKYSEPKNCIWKTWRPSSEWNKVEFILASSRNSSPEVSGRKK
jgi:hypothetical protein